MESVPQSAAGEIARQAIELSDAIEGLADVMSCLDTANSTGGELDETLTALSELNFAMTLLMSQAIQLTVAARAV